MAFKEIQISESQQTYMFAGDVIIKQSVVETMGKHLGDVILMLQSVREKAQKAKGLTNNQISFEHQEVGVTILFVDKSSVELLEAPQKGSDYKDKLFSSRNNFVSVKLSK